MNQNINLLLVLPQRSKWDLTAKRMLQIIAVWVVLLVLYSMFSVWLANKTENKLAALKTKKETMTKQLMELAVKNPPLAKDENLAREIKDLTTTVETKQKLIKTLSGFRSSSAGFSSYLEALSEYIPDNVWLKSINVGENGEAIALKGSALSSALVPQFVEALKKSPVFKDVRFGTFTVTTSEEGKKVNFILRTATEKEQKK